MWIREDLVVYQNVEKDKIINDLKALVNDAENFTENIDIEFIKFKMLHSSGNN